MEKRPRRRRHEIEAETAAGKKRRTRLKSGGSVPGKASRARPDRRERAAARDVGAGIDPARPASPSATAPHIQTYVPSAASVIRGAGPPGAPAAAKQDDPATDALSTIGAVEDRLRQ